MPRSSLSAPLAPSASLVPRLSFGLDAVVQSPMALLSGPRARPACPSSKPISSSRNLICYHSTPVKWSGLDRNQLQLQAFSRGTELAPMSPKFNTSPKRRKAIHYSVHLAKTITYMRALLRLLWNSKASHLLY